MNATSAVVIRTTTAIGAAAVALAAFVGLGFTEQAEAAGTYSKTLTFTLSTTNPAPADGELDDLSFGQPGETSSSLNFVKYEVISTEYGKDGAKGGNVEFEWKVEEGES